MRRSPGSYSRLGLPFPAALVAVALLSGAARADKTKVPPNNVPGERKGVKAAAPKGGDQVNNTTVFGSWRTVDYRTEKQGALGDCFLLSVLADDAYQNPGDIPLHHFVHDASGKLTVYNEGGKQLVGVIFKTLGHGTTKGSDHIVKVENKLYLKDGKPIFAQADHGMVFALLEQAYAQFRDSQGSHVADANHTGLNKINQGGDPARVMEALTGQAAHTVNIPIDPKKATGIFTLLSNANKGMLVAAGTSAEGKEWTTRITTAVAKGLLDPALGKATANSRGLVEAHSYSVFSTRTAKVKQSDGKLANVRLVHLRNPWGSKVPKGATQTGLRNGEFELKLEEFMAYYDQLYVGGKVSAGHKAHL